VTSWVETGGGNMLARLALA